MHLRGADITEAFPRFSPKTSVLKLLIEGLEYNGNQVAQIEVATGKSYTFADLLQRSKSIAGGLNKQGIGHGDFVVICCRKSSLAYAIQLGIMFCGATPVLIDTKCANEIHRFVKGHVIKAGFCDKNNFHMVNQSLSQVNMELTFIATTDINDTIMKLLIEPSNVFSLFEVKDNKNDVVLVLFTSGSTSDPKGVQVSDLGLQRLGYSFVDELIESYLLVGSFAWISSTISLVSSILKGYPLVLSEENDISSHLKIVEKYRVDGWTVFGGNISLYAKEASLQTLDLSSLAVVNVGGAVVKRKSLEAFISNVLRGKIGTQVLYGMTEVGIITTWRNKDLLDLSKADSSGYLAPGVEVKITDEGGHLADPGNVGEIRVKSLSTMVGYWGRPELTSRLFENDGFFRTGDIGYFDNDGFLYIVGRVSDIVPQGEFKVSTSEVEDLLRTHASVLDAAVMPCNVHSLVAFVVLSPGCAFQEEEISTFISEQMGETVKLKGVHKVESIPRTHSGKVHQGLLKRLADTLLTP